MPMSIGHASKAAALMAAGLLMAPVGSRAETAAPDQTPAQAVRKVCTACHGLEIVMDTPRDYNSWHDTVQTMIDRGADGSQQDFAQVMQFLFENMTTVDVNTADAEALATVLHATAPQVAAIEARRRARPFRDLADLLAAVPGLNGALLKAKQRMIFF